MSDKATSDDVNYFQKYALKVAENGWPIVLLGHAKKKPLVNGWQNKDIPLSKIKQLAASGRKFGIGIRCGNIVGLDDDYEEGGAVTEDFLQAVEDLKNHFFPEVLLRRGRPTRPPLRVIRLDEGEVFKSLNIDKLQIIGKGRQFVAYNEHPDTGKPYAWLKAGEGSPLTVNISDVPTYSAKKLKQFINAMLLLEETFGLSPDKGSDVLRQIKSGEAPKLKTLQAEQALVEKACEYIENDAKWGWEDWNNNIMMPLYNASNGEEWGRDLAHELSEKSELYDEDATNERWDQIAKHPAALLGWPRLNWLARQGGMPFLGPKDWEEYRFIDDQESFYNIRTKSWQTQQWFNTVYHAARDKKLNSVQTFIKSHPEHQLDSLTWNPYLSTGATTQNGKRIWNTWKAPDWFGSEGDVEPWLWIIDHIFDKEAELVIKRFAFDVQFPHKRPQWHVYVTGGNGLGKSDAVLPLVKWMGRFGLHAGTDSMALKSEFKSFLAHKKLITINEVKGISSGAFNEMKDMLAGGEQEITINEKFKIPRSEAIVASFYLSSNFQNALSLSEIERRLLVKHSDKPSPFAKGNERLKPAAIQRHKWIEKNWDKVIYYLKHEVQVDDGFGNALPRTTDDQIRTAHMTAPSHERIASYIRDIVKDKLVFTINMVYTALQHEDMGVDTRELNYPMVWKALYHLGAVRCADGKIVNFPGQKRLRLWSLRRELAASDFTTLRELWFLAGGDLETEAMEQ